jgi:general secretion pathway protein D
VTRSRSLRAILTTLALVLVAGLGLPSASFGQERSFLLNYKKVQIVDLIERVSSETRRSILFDEQVRGNISIVTKRPVTEGEAWSILDSSLSMLGFSLLPSTVDNWRILKVAEAVGEAPFVAEIDTKSASFVTTLIPLVNSDSQAVMKVLEPLSGTRVTLVPFEPTHSLIASGPEWEIARLTTIADELDRVDKFELQSRVLRYRGIDEIEPLVEARLESDGISDRQLQVWSDERTNSILYRGNEYEVARLARFLDRVDQPIEGTGRVRIFRVLNRDPEEVGELIRELGQASGSERAAGSSVTRGSELAGADFVLVVDKASRSLVVSADTETQIIIREVLEMIDELPQLIAVDITVSELRTPENFLFGLGFSLPISAGNDIDALIINSPTAGGLPTGPGPNTQFFGRVSRDTGFSVTLPGGEGIEIPIAQTGVISAGEFSAHNEILIQPSLILVAGEHHEIFVGTNVPVPVTEESGTPDSLISALSRTTTFERTDIGIRLGIDAIAGRKGKIQLALDIDVSSIAPSVAGDIAEVGPTFVSQILQATARLDDGETAIIGMLNQKTEVRFDTGIPWLSDIPFFGWLFGTEGRDDLDVRLVIAARASRISTPAELVADSIRRRLAFQRRNARDGGLPDFEGPPYGVRVTTRTREDDAEAISQGLSIRGYQTAVHSWTLSGEQFFDVYIVSLGSMAEAAEVAGVLSQDGWEADLVVLPRRS